MHKVIAIATATTTLKWHRFIIKKREKNKQKTKHQTNKQTKTVMIVTTLVIWEEDINYCILLHCKLSQIQVCCLCSLLYLNFHKMYW